MFYVAILSNHDSPETQSQGARDFSQPSREDPSTTQPPVGWVAGLFIGAEAERVGVDHLLLSSAEVRERVQDHDIG